MKNLFPAPFFGYILNVFSLTKKRKYVRTKTPLRLNQNVLAFRITSLRFLSNALVFLARVKNYT